MYSFVILFHSGTASIPSIYGHSSKDWHFSPDFTQPKKLFKLMVFKEQSIIHPSTALVVLLPFLNVPFAAVAFDGAVAVAH